MSAQSALPLRASTTSPMTVAQQAAHRHGCRSDQRISHRCLGTGSVTVLALYPQYAVANLWSSAARNRTPVTIEALERAS
jgi:hypothetical protein